MHCAKNNYFCALVDDNLPILQISATQLTFLFMNTKTITGLGLMLLAACSQPKNPDDKMRTKPSVLLSDPDLVEIKYPNTKTVAQEDVFFGQKVADPYRWLEGENPADSSDLQAWIQAQSKTADYYLKAIPLREAIETRLKEVWNFPKMGVPFKEGNYYYFYKNTGLQNQSVLYQSTKPDTVGKLFLDPNTLSEDGTISLGALSFSNDGKYCAYATAQSGSDWQTIWVKSVETGELLKDKVEWVRYSGLSWYKEGFFYSRFPETGEQEGKFTAKNEFQQLYYHKLGTPQSDDQIIYADRSQPTHMHSGEVSEDERFLFIYTSETTSGNKLAFKRLGVENAPIEPIIDDFNHDHSVVDVEGDKMLLLTNYKAPNYQLVEVDLNNPQPEKWKTIIKTDPKRVLESVKLAGTQLIAVFMQDVSHKMYLWERTGKAGAEITLPDSIGQVGTISSKKNNTQVFYGFSSFVQANSIYQLDLASKQSNLWRASAIKFDYKDYTSKQVFYKSADGTSVPMFIVHKKDLELNGSNPTILYGYGGFNISLLPSFLLEEIPFLENGGVYAVANIRGGGEYGKDWHDGGRLLKKQNVFNDFIAAAEYLIAQKYTSKSKLAIEGGSNGGLLVGACMTQRPDLFKVAIPAVGVLDMLRYHKFTIGSAWATDYGTAEDSVHFANLIKYSPVHNTRKNNYPATLIMTAEFDDRVVPAHSYKFAAALQAAQTAHAPILLRIDTKAGHGAGKPTEKQIEEAADKYAFIMFNLGLK